jgi:hypothetical protein
MANVSVMAYFIRGTRSANFGEWTLMAAISVSFFLPKAIHILQDLANGLPMEGGCFLMPEAAFGGFELKKDCLREDLKNRFS